jgi:NTP pyrophosphatase (non-canonical NTP hydrolase)
MMDSIDRYQELAARTKAAYDEDPKFELAIMALGLAGEAGELADYIKKVVGHGHEMDQNRVVKEMGDVYWYLAAIASWMDVDSSLILQANIQKLTERYPDGFSTERSVNRESSD